MNNEPLGTGALPSKLDPRTIKHEEVAMAGAPLVKGGFEYEKGEHDHQHNEGICTAIHLTQNREKAKGRKYSADFQYLLQKKFLDKNWYEGSSIFIALKVGNKVGFLPLEAWTHTTENDRYLPYEEYIAKLSAIPDSEIERLAGKRVVVEGKDEWQGGLCVDKLPGYASVDASDPQKIAQAIVDSEAGVLCMYGCGNTWWLPSWLKKHINPLRRPFPYTSYHAIIMSAFDYTNAPMQRLANTWGDTWCDEGDADINYSKYAPIEVWSILKVAPVIPPYKFTHDLWFGRRDIDNIELQRRLGVSPTDQNFGPKTFAAVVSYQKAHGITPTGYVGPKTRASLNA